MAKGYIGTVVSVGSVVTALILITLLATTPVALGPLGVTAWFIGLFVALSCWAGLAVYWVGAQLKARQSTLVANSWRRGMFIGGYITVLVAMSSLQQLSIKDALLLGILLGLLEFYMVAKG